MVDQNETEIRTDEERVSGGSKEGVVRWVLGIGLLLAVVLLSLIWIVPALTQSGEDDASSRVVAPQEETDTSGDDTDGLVTPDTMAGDDATAEPAAPDAVESAED